MAFLTIIRPTMRPRILIVEDESGIADTLQYVLATDGFDAGWCATAEQALREFAAQPPRSRSSTSACPT